MSYQIHYEEPGGDAPARRERFRTEAEALRRAGELLEENDAYVVSIADDAGRVVSGVRLQLKLGYPTA